MLTVRLLVSGASWTSEHALRTGEALLVGRKPDPSTVPAALRSTLGEITPVTVRAQVVSEQHCVVWRDGAGVHLRDLQSTNGTRWMLPPGQTVSADADAVTLALGPDVAELDAPPAPVEWSDAEDFRARVCGAVDAWLTSRGVHARVALSRELEGADPRDVPLGDGWALRLRPARVDATLDLRLDRAMPMLWDYVRTQRGAFEVDRGDVTSHDDLVLASPATQALHRRICQAARRGLHGVLQGETGAGKSALARCFHLHSPRRDGPFVETNLAEDSDDRKYFQLKLFGARAGASSSITRDQVGLVQAAHGGTLFLDEVALLPLEVQGMLLRFLDRGTYRRLGEAGDAPERRADVRVVVGTNADLRAAVQRGAFREDLWWRLSGVVLEVPPLRDRREDIEAVLRREAVDLARGPVCVLDALRPDARDYLLRQHPWRGNFRELYNFLARLPMYVEGAHAVDLAACTEALAAGALAPLSRSSAPEPVAPPAPGDTWADLLPLAHRLLPLWLAERAARTSEPVAPGFAFRVFQEEVLKPLCMARALGVEHWDHAPRRPDPSYRAMADALGYADGKTVQTALALYVELRHLRARLDGP